MSLFTKAPRRAESSEINTVIGPEAYFHGVVTVRGSVHVQGKVEGNVSEAQTVVVGRGGGIQGDVCAEFISVSGDVVGDVVATQQLELKAGGKIVGNIRTPRLLIEEGAIFEGTCSMAGAELSGKSESDDGSEAASETEDAEESASLK